MRSFSSHKKLIYSRIKFLDISFSSCMNFSERWQSTRFVIIATTGIVQLHQFNCRQRRHRHTICIASSWIRPGTIAARHCGRHYRLLVNFNGEVSFPRFYIRISKIYSKLFKRYWVASTHTHPFRYTTNTWREQIDSFYLSGFTIVPNFRYPSQVVFILYLFERFICDRIRSCFVSISVATINDCTAPTGHNILCKHFEPILQDSNVNSSIQCFLGARFKCFDSHECVVRIEVHELQHQLASIEWVSRRRRPVTKRPVKSSKWVSSIERTIFSIRTEVDQQKGDFFSMGQFQFRFQSIHSHASRGKPYWFSPRAI